MNTTITLAICGMERRDELDIFKIDFKSHDKMISSILASYYYYY